MGDEHHCGRTYREHWGWFATLIGLNYKLLSDCCQAWMFKILKSSIGGFHFNGEHHHRHLFGSGDLIHQPPFIGPCSLVKSLFLLFNIPSGYD
jgi:hypothetical protein